MAWAYCSTCEGELDYPETIDIINQVQICPHCERECTPNESIEDALHDMLERIEKLERTALTWDSEIPTDRTIQDL